MRIHWFPVWLPALAVICCLVAVAAFSGVSLYAQEDFAANRQFNAAVKLQNLESYDMASGAWSDFVTKYPSDSRLDKAQYNLGVCHYQLGKTGDALPVFQAVVKQYPKFELADAATLYIGLIQYAAGRAGDGAQFAESAKTFRELVGKYPKSEHLCDARQYLAESLYMSDQKDAAVREYDSWLTAYPDSDQRPDLLYALGVTYDELDRLADAAKTYDTFLRENSQHELVSELELRRGDIDFREKKYAEAIRWFDKYVARPNMPMADYALLRKGESAGQLKQYPAAAAAFELLVQNYPESSYQARAKLAAGKSFFLAADYGNSRKHLYAIYQLGGADSPEALHLIVQSLLKENRPADAGKFLVGELSKVKDEEWRPQLMLDLADAYYAMPDQKARASQVYAQVADQYADSDLAAQSRYMASFAALEGNDYSGSKAQAEKFLAAYAKHELTGDLLHLAAESSMQLSETADAESYYAKAIAAVPDSPSVTLWSVRRAMALHALGRGPDAAGVLQGVLGRIDPAADPLLAAEARFLMGDSLLAAKKYKEAANWLEQSFSAKPDWERADQVLFALADAFRLSGDADRARDTLKQLATKYPGSELLDRVNYRLGELCHTSGKSAEAAVYYERVIREYGDSDSVPDALYELACLQMEQGSAKSADATLSTLMTRFPEHLLAGRGRYIRGRARYQEKDYQGAIADINAALPGLVSGVTVKSGADGHGGTGANSGLANTDAGKKDVADATYVLGLCYVELKQYDDAIRSLQKLLADYPGYASADDARNQLAWSLKLSGREDEAAREFELLAKSTSSGSLAAEGQYHTGQRAYDQEDYAAAELAFEAVIKSIDKSDDKSAGNKTLGRNAMHRLAWARYQQDDVDGAIVAFERQLSTYPGGEKLENDARFMLAECLYQKEKFSDAYEAYRKTDVATLSSDAYRELALLHACQSAGQSGHWRESLGWSQQLVAKYPKSKEVPTALYEQGWAQQNLGDREAAVRLYRDVIEKTDAEPAARAQFMIGEIQFAERDHAEAVKSYFNVLYGYSSPRWQANSAYEAARCFEVLGKPTQAEKLYRELLTDFPESEKAKLARERVDALEQR